MSRNLQEKVLKAMLCMTRQCWEQGIAAQCLLEIGREEELALLDAMLSYETKEHTFHDVLDRPETFTESETGAMTAYVFQASGSPDFIHAGTSVECQAHFLMMQHWKEKLEKREVE